LTIHHRASATTAKFFASPNGKPVSLSIMQKRSRKALAARAPLMNVSIPIENVNGFLMERQTIENLPEEEAEQNLHDELFQ
jgi:hypothetical protein